MTALLLSFAYLRHYWGRSLALLLATALTLFLPLAVNILIDRGEAQLRERAAATPLLIGAKGSRVDLMIEAAYFRRKKVEPIQWRDYEELSQRDKLWAIPLATGARANAVPIVGTNLDYFDARGLEFADGMSFIQLGDCVLGARAAEELEAGVGGYVVSTPDNVFNLAGEYPLKMLVRGVLEPIGTPDDYAVFVDVKTYWTIMGLAHGHQDLDLANPIDTSVVLKQKNGVTIANEALVKYNEITEENIAYFHFHGDPAEFPLSAVLVIADTPKDETLLRGEYEVGEQIRMAVKPAVVTEDLLQTVFQVRSVLAVIYAGVCVATAILVFLVFVLSWRLRAEEIDTMARLGASRWRIAQILASEVLLLLVASGGLAWLGALGIDVIAPGLFRMAL